MEILDSKRASECTVGFENCAAESFSIPIVRVSIERPPYAIALRLRGREQTVFAARADFVSAQ
jgi:hypothetical protein